MIFKPSRRELLKYGVGTAFLAKVASEQTYPFPGVPPPAGGGGGGGYSILSGANGHVSASAVDNATTSAIDTSTAKLLIAFVSAYTNGPADNFGDSKSNSWTALTTKFATAGNDRITIYYCLNPTSVGSSHTFSNSAVGSYTALAVLAFTKGSNTSYVSETGASDQNCDTGVNTAHPGSQTVATGDLIVSGITIPFGFTYGMVVDSGLTLIETVNNGGTEGLAAAYMIQAGSGSVNPGWNTSPSGSGQQGVVAGVFH